MFFNKNKEVVRKLDQLVDAVQELTSINKRLQELWEQSTSPQQKAAKRLQELWEPSVSPQRNQKTIKITSGKRKRFTTAELDLIADCKRQKITNASIAKLIGRSTASVQTIISKKKFT